MEVKIRYDDGNIVYQIESETLTEKSINESVEYMKSRIFTTSGNLYIQFMPKEATHQDKPKEVNNVENISDE